MRLRTTWVALAASAILCAVPLSVQAQEHTPAQGGATDEPVLLRICYFVAPKDTA